ncbi:DinB family protein [Chitinophaga vietnamensis]|uniref:DinB family protein n=1 Tax=Chitinophaga vietnamensis TaxID=2593957 RepID=UPI00117767C4|nr:DinB family protein [Chitinophaga vietnamensis]
MKRTLLLLAVVVCSAFLVPKQPTVREDRSLLLSELKNTKENLLKTVQGLSDAQLQYKPAPDRWSVIECVEHITLIERFFREAEQSMIKEPANPDKKKDVKVTDDFIVKSVEDRSHKRQAPEFGQPKNTFGSPSATIAAFSAQRDSLIDYVTNTTDDMRNHLTDKSPFGTIDAYQLLLLDAAHTARHTKQMQEVKADSGFPK